MASGVKRGLKSRLSEWHEHSKFSMQGILLATKNKHFWFGFVPTFCIFGTLLNLLAGGFAAFNLIGAAGFPAGLKIIWNAFLQTFGINRNFVDWLGIFLLALLQGILIGLLVVVIKNTPKTSAKTPKISKATRHSNKKSPLNPAENLSESTSASVGNSGIVAILALLGSGCPTCGTALLTPLLTTIFGSGVALAGTVSAVITWLAILLALFTIKKLGYNAYVVIATKNLSKNHGIIEKRSVDEKRN
ncbi:hypothetical protein IJN73_02325 [Candidatus Saccharibacteria bacterium]|nr:hypothetical protein [Candidatus Saccharibacteria bacterium]